jgi:hypothetical protein
MRIHGTQDYSSKPVRSCNPRLGRFDSCAAPLKHVDPYSQALSKLERSGRVDPERLLTYFEGGRPLSAYWLREGRQPKDVPA